MTVRPQGNARTDLILRIHFVWRVVFAALGVAGLYFAWQGAFSEIAVWQKYLAAVLVALAAIFSLVAAVHIWRRNRKGRLIALALDYLAFLICAVLALN